jgi:uncharacterized protein
MFASQPKETMMANPFVHVELMSTDVGKSKEFYGKLFDWQLVDMEMKDGMYTVIKVGTGTGGGMMKNPMPGQPSSWLPYVDVNDLATASAKAKSLGGKILKDVTEVEGMGSFVIVGDPTGAPIGLWKVK